MTEMSNEMIYGPWIEWHGGECPVPSDTKVGLRFRSGETETGYSAGETETGYSAGDYYWDHYDDDGDIVEYRTITEQADLGAAEKLLLANDYTITPPAKPLTFEQVVPMTEAPPKGTWYWVIQPFISRGVEAFAWGGDEHDLAALRHRMAYLNREHALVAARHIFGLKGGEL